MINVATMIGLAIGSVWAGDFISGGRRKTLWVCNIIIVFSVVLSVILNFWTLCFGKVLLGVAAGAF